jgi:hypothetical protein
VSSLSKYAASQGAAYWKYTGTLSKRANNFYGAAKVKPKK